MSNDTRLTHALRIAGVAAMAFCVAGCVDDGYDLSDIDTDEVRININNLVLPINLKPVELENLIDADASDDPDASEFRYDKNTGNYFIVTTGDFNTEPFDIGGIYVEAPKPSTKTDTTPLAPGTFDLSQLPELDLESFNHEFSYTYDHVDSYIEDIDVIAVDKLTFTARLWAETNGVKLSDCLLHLPAGLKYSSLTASDGAATPTYDFSTGTVKVGGTYSDVTVTMVVDSVYVHEAGGSFDRATDTFTFNGYLGLRGGKAVSTITTDSEVLSLYYSLSDLKITAVSGRIYYNAEIDDTNVSLTDLPEELRQSGTDLKLVNPQVYLNLTNPFAANGVYARTDMEFYQVRNGVTASKASASATGVCVGGDADRQYSEQTICLAAERPTDPYTPFTSFHACPGLGSVVSGNGLPDELQVRFTNAGIPSGTRVVNFPIGDHNTREIRGTYTLYVPLALEEGSTVTYTGDTNDWDIDDTDELHIDYLQVTAQVTNGLPLGVELSALPIDAEGNVLNHVTVHPATIAAGATSKVEIGMTAQPGTSITGIDGLRYTAKVTADASRNVLNKNMKLTLTDIRVKVNGYYQSKKDKEDKE